MRVVVRATAGPISTSFPGGGATNSTQPYTCGCDEHGSGPAQFTLGAAGSDDRSAVERPGSAHQSAPADLRPGEHQLPSLPGARGARTEVRPDGKGLSGSCQLRPVTRSDCDGQASQSNVGERERVGGSHRTG